MSDDPAVLQMLLDEARLERSVMVGRARKLRAERDAALAEVAALRAAVIELHDDLGGSAPWPTLEEIRPRLRHALDVLPVEAIAARTPKPGVTDMSLCVECGVNPVATPGAECADCQRNS